jgi:hypothetical protein
MVATHAFLLRSHIRVLFMALYGSPIWTPLAMAPSAFDDFKKPFVRILSRLKPGVALQQAQKAVNEVEAVVAASHPDTTAAIMWSWSRFVNN